MIVVATADFELYHEAVDELRSRGVSFTTVEPGDPIPEQARVLITGPNDDIDADIARVTATGDDVRRAVDEALTTLRGGGGQTIVGVDPGIRPGIAVLSGETVVAAFHVPLANAVDVIRQETEDAVDPVVRIGDGARLQGAKLINDLDGVAVELVDETGTTPYLGTGARGMGDVLAAVNIARMNGEDTESREIEPTEGELQRIKDRSREASDDSRSIDDELARRVAGGELSIEEALVEHRAREE
ncbi:hypothetical protein E6P09_14835 [Haloferax mediterranei ATCC 33500]|uniref:Uncharacterized protein n=1 Tax=Haloferax mediterranei (strain ATCC 33500 / DSM 1411 / JCM 8866 / NBRC 14739 / NCIMB 2177 / R-4) TaxID=523841 RepID=I3R767_HALMT|nr:hypothetical protein [Haloferax mediterranei]AFK20077.1 hypothetical protein HFX_2391 [Haloferax mediterranei ATCC 33500]AHZ23453.1 hypothetical protein BM92_12740 [Haloferax mediterranei ATCC 33500]ELZ99624.1 hypothetical protein C439_13759 [Haloferax mediterranei ATCC 33500]MDX5987172.1 hypothetical protein [Haloferax mediterranei ATCC 33500]QCQ76479.1 hypothetical protein E6P09_14835 [Haloferax mediterranei ATCC 33500]